MLTFGSLFSGGGLMDHGLHRAGWECLWQCEKDPAARRVLAARFPGVECYPDVATLNGADLPKVDAVVGGFPCQSLSVAGKRAGLADAQKSGLFFEMARVIGEARPAWVLMENVPGLLSSNNGDDFATVLDTLNDLRYIVDVDVLDARRFGLPQRRRRVFFVCESLEHFQSKKTLTSLLTISQCLVEISGLILTEHLGRSLSAPGNSGCERSGGVAGLTRRMKLFGLLSASGPYKMWLENWGGGQEKSAQGRGPLAFSEKTNGGSPGRERTGIGTDTSSTTGDAAPTERLSRSPFTGRSWSDTLDDICETARRCITSTGTRTTTESTIYTCALALLRIAWLICRSSRSSPSYWNAASSASTAIRGYMSYARQTGESLFGEERWVRPWRDFLCEAGHLLAALRPAGDDHRSEVRPEPESSRRHPATGTEAGPGAAAAAPGGPDGGGRGAFAEEGEGHVGYRLTEEAAARRAAAGGGSTKANLVAQARPAVYGGAAPGERAEAAALTAHPSRLDFDSENFVVEAVGGGHAHALTSVGADASEDGTGRGTPVVAVHLTQDPIIGDDLSPCLGTGSGSGGAACVGVLSVRTAQTGANGIGVQEDMAPTLDSSTPVVAVAQNQRGELRESGAAPALTAGGGKPGEGYPAVRAGAVLRRLTPTECLRLMGMPDDWLDLTPPLADGAKYRICGLGVAANVAEWLGRRILEVDEREG